MIHVFKTTVESSEHVEKLGSELNSILGDSAEWSFDLDDCDRVLRIVHPSTEVALACREVLTNNGFGCEELND